jgi:hypothetical protein
MVEERKEELGVASTDLFERQSVGITSGLSFRAQAFEVVVQVASSH